MIKFVTIFNNFSKYFKVPDYIQTDYAGNRGELNGKLREATLKKQGCHPSSEIGSQPCLPLPKA